MVISITPDKTKGLVSNQGNNSVSVIDIATLSVIKTVNNGGIPFDEPTQILINPDGTIDDTISPFGPPGWVTFFEAPMDDFAVTGKTGRDCFFTETNNFVKLSWTSSVQETFNIYRDSKLVGAVSGQCPLKFTDNNLKSKKTYTYRVVALSSAGSALAEGVLKIKAK